MNLQGKTMVSVFLSADTLGIIEVYAKKAYISESEAIDRLITQCAKMVVTGVIEEVTEKDVFEKALITTSDMIELLQREKLCLSKSDRPLEECGQDLGE